MTLGLSVEGGQGRPGQTQDGRLLVNPVKSWQLPWPVAAVIFALAAVMILVLALAHNPHKGRTRASPHCHTLHFGLHQCSHIQYMIKKI